MRAFDQRVRIEYIKFGRYFIYRKIQMFSMVAGQLTCDFLAR